MIRYHSRSRSKVYSRGAVIPDVPSLDFSKTFNSMYLTSGGIFF